MNPRAGCPAYRISSADPSATWVHLQSHVYDHLSLYRLKEGKSNYFWNMFLDEDVKLYYDKKKTTVRKDFSRQEEL